MLDKAVALGKQAFGLAWHVAGFALDKAKTLVPGVGTGPAPPDEEERPVAPRPPDQPSRDAPAASPPLSAAAPSPPARREPPAPPEPEHIEVEDELVGEFAEQGAEDGAGAEIEVAEPWPGYAALSATDVIDRLAAASEAERAVVGLYEREHKKRRTVLAAVEAR
jgi:hypothetical protein